MIIALQMEIASTLSSSSTSLFSSGTNYRYKQNLKYKDVNQGIISKSKLKGQF